MAGRSPWQTPLLVPFAVLAFWNRPYRRQAALLALYLFYVFCVWWAFTHRIDRFWVPALPLAAWLAGIGATWSDETGWRRLRGGLLAVGLAGNFVLAVGPAGYNRFFVGYARLRAAPERVDPWHLELNRRVAEGDAVLAAGDAQVFDLEPSVYYNTVFDTSLLEAWLEGRSPSDFHAELLRRRISHVWVHWGEIARYRSPGNYGFTPFVQPEVFSQLVADGVLHPAEPPIDGHPGQVFRVREGPNRPAAAEGVPID